MAEWVRYKDRANYCDYFEAAESIELGKKSAAAGADEARKAWDRLFKS
ncbi:MAG: hypothetical protein PHX83_12770 [Acidobacteriia bacterium]|nr:hypothetical protein [Terriglobia bacterium]